MNIEIKNKNEPYIHNNWLKNYDHEILKELYSKGCGLYLSKDGSIVYRYFLEGDWITIKDFRALENPLSNLSEREVDLSPFYKKEAKDINQSMTISPSDLLLVIDEIFDPSINQEFIKSDNNTYLRNMYRPSYYMQLDGNKNLSNFDVNASVIIKLIFHLAHNDNQRTFWILNWLAYFFQSLKKSQVALVLIGSQGAGKGILFNNIIKPLIGEEYTKVINDKSLNSNYLGGVLENALFYNLDEISAKKSISSSVKNFLKALVTNDTITAEKKFKTMNKETKLYGQVLITTNENYPIEIEDGDRRYTVFNTGGNLQHNNYLGLGSYESLSMAIKNELEAFMGYLKNFQVDTKLANTALTTVEKERIINEYRKTQNNHVLKLPKLNKLQKNINDFIFNIQTGNINYFGNLAHENYNLYVSIVHCMNQGVFRVDNLLPAFKALYGSNIKTVSELLLELQKDLSNQFRMENQYRYNIQGENVDVFRIIPIINQQINILDNQLQLVI